jgi:hypothetical protein
MLKTFEMRATDFGKMKKIHSVKRAARASVRIAPKADSLSPTMEF